MIEKFFKKRMEGENEIYHITTPCKFVIKENIVNQLRTEYKTAEEIGGVLWAKGAIVDDKLLFEVDKVSFIRNAIEDKPRTDHRNKSNAYSFDVGQLLEIYKQTLANGYYPIKFHTHPTKGDNFLEEFMKFSAQLETSELDRVESENWMIIENKKVLLPRALVVGNDLIKNTIFIGLYHGFIAPQEFGITKKEFTTALNCTSN